MNEFNNILYNLSQIILILFVVCFIIKVSRYKNAKIIINDERLNEHNIKKYIKNISPSNVFIKFIYNDNSFLISSESTCDTFHVYKNHKPIVTLKFEGNEILFKIFYYNSNKENDIIVDILSKIMSNYSKKQQDVDMISNIIYDMVVDLKKIKVTNMKIYK